MSGSSPCSHIHPTRSIVPTMPPIVAKSPSRNTVQAKAAPRRAAKRATAAPTKLAHAAVAMTVLQQFRELFRVSQQHFQRIESNCGVSGAQLWALSELEAAPGLTVSGLARALSIHLSTSSNLLDKLEAQELIRRQRNSLDQRVVQIYLTNAGQQLLRKAPMPVEGVIPDALGRMPTTALTSLKRDLDLLLGLASVRNPGERMKPLAEP
jgi:DNA-binding MarR family transcriptional regulator